MTTLIIVIYSGIFILITFYSIYAWQDTRLIERETVDWLLRQVQINSEIEAIKRELDDKIFDERVMKIITRETINRRGKEC